MLMQACVNDGLFTAATNMNHARRDTHTHTHTHTALTCRPGTGECRCFLLSLLGFFHALWWGCDASGARSAVWIIRCSEHIYRHTEGRLPQWEHRLCVYTLLLPRLTHSLLLPSHSSGIPLTFSRKTYVLLTICITVLLTITQQWVCGVRDVESEVKEWKESRKESEDRGKSRIRQFLQSHSICPRPG